VFHHEGVRSTAHRLALTILDEVSGLIQFDGSSNSILRVLRALRGELPLASVL
jgi:hypothetical protein